MRAIVENINTTDIEALIQAWTHVIQALVGGIGALAFVLAFLWKIARSGESDSAVSFSLDGIP